MRTRINPEKQVERDCDNALTALGFKVTRFSQPRATMQTEGIPDRFVTHSRFRLCLWIEYKAGRNQLSHDQAAWHYDTKTAGGDVVTVWGLSDLLYELKTRGVPIT